MRISLELQGSVSLGLSDDGRWVVATADGIVVLDEKSDYTGALPLLECPPGEFDLKLSGVLSEICLPQTLAFTFPVEPLVCFGLAAWGDYWPTLALSWAETLGVTPAISEALRELMTHGKTQMIRHRAKRLFFRSGRTRS